MPETVPRLLGAWPQAAGPTRIPTASAGAIQARFLPRARSLRSAGEDKPGPAVDKLAYRVEVTGMTGGLGYHVQDDLAQIVQPPAAEELLGPPGRRGIHGSSGDDRVRELDLLPVQVDDGLSWHVLGDLPGTAGGLAAVAGLTGDDAAEPELLDVQGEMAHQPQARPLGREHGPPQIVIGQAVG